ncbi:MAG: P-loop NTPase [Nitrososphaerota archaeon]|nr:P-loop NTPase [Nitrososphaerota archaeon]
MRFTLPRGASGGCDKCSARGRKFKGPAEARVGLVTREEVLRALAGVKDPELGRDVVSLRMVDGVEVDGDRVAFTLNLTTPACPLRSRLEEAARAAVAGIPGVKHVEMKTGSSVYATRDYAEAEVLRGVKNIIAVASGKGGVGKSTVAVNLACALAATGAKVGILDADVYGPTIPLMMGAKSQPEVRDEKVIPPVAHGVKVASLGFFYNEETPVIWRGPLVAGAVRQLLTQVAWGELDYLVCDMPPGCLPAGTSILMADNSTKPIEKVEVGEFLLSYDGQSLVPRRVLGTVPQGEQEVFRLRAGDREIVASANHPFLSRHGTSRWVRLDQLRAGDRVVVPNCVSGGQPLRLPKAGSDPEVVQLPGETTADFMRVVGHFVAGGSLTRRRGGERPVGLRLRQRRGTRFRKTHEGLYMKVFKGPVFDDDGGPGLAVASPPLAELFEALDLDHKARERSVPRWIFTLPLDQRLAFIRGYAEAGAVIRRRESTRSLPGRNGMEGAVTVVQETATVEGPNAALADKFRELCAISGVRSTKPRLRGGQRLPEGRTGSGAAGRRFQFALEHDPRPFRFARVQSVEPMGRADTYDLQVDQYENFVANSILVHNTGDASLTLAQTVPLGGILIVTTPQDAALSIAAKALAMFKRLDAPILGVVENMSYFVCPHCGERTDIFSSGGGKKIAAERGVDYLGEIPLAVAVREQSDRGEPVVASDPDSPESMVYKELAFKVAGMLSIVAYSKMKK